MTLWAVICKKTGTVLGRVEKFHLNVGSLKNPSWRVWFRDADDPSIEADRCSVIALYIAGTKKYRLEKLS